MVSCLLWVKLRKSQSEHLFPRRSDQRIFEGDGEPHTFVLWLADLLSSSPSSREADFGSRLLLAARAFGCGLSGWTRGVSMPKAIVLVLLAIAIVGGATIITSFALTEGTRLVAVVVAQLIAILFAAFIWAKSR
jgi:hypothetical protein